MSSTISSISSVVSSAEPSSSGAGGNNAQTVQQQSNFYRNLFYILIGLLGAFCLISILSLFRARHRRKRIRAEALRLGVLVPGMEGYIPLRERASSRFVHPDARVRPDWWEIGAVGWMKSWARPGLPERGYSAVSQSGLTSGMGFEKLHQSSFTDDPSPFDIASDKISFHPLAIIPPPTIISPSDPVPAVISALPYFPSHLAYKSADLLPPPPKWEKAEVSQIDELSGGTVGLVTMIRMPAEEVPVPKSVADGEEDAEEVIREWGGVCLGVVSVSVDQDGGAGRSGWLYPQADGNGKAREIR